MAGGKSGRALSASQANLPSVTSVYPLRRSVSLTSADRASAERNWQALLRDRLGSPGQPPGRDVLPSLYDRPERSRASADRPASRASGSQPPSTVGPSASIVAWFAQFQCEGCGRIPTSLEARFCFSCGQLLPLPPLPGGASGAGSKVSGNAPKNLAAVAAAAEAQADRRRGAREGGGSEAQPTAPPAPDRRPPRPPGKAADPRKPQVPWSTRESQVAVWLGNIKPRMP